MYIQDIKFEISSYYILSGSIAVISPAVTLFLNSFLKENSALVLDFWSLRYFNKNYKSTIHDSIFLYLVNTFCYQIGVLQAFFLIFGVITVGLIKALWITMAILIVLIVVTRIVCYRIYNSTYYSLEDAQQVREIITADIIEDTAILGSYTVCFPSVLIFSIKNDTEMYLNLLILIYVFILVGRVIIASYSRKNFEKNRGQNSFK